MRRLILLFLFVFSTLSVFSRNIIDTQDEIPIHYVSSFINAQCYDKVTMIRWIKFNLYQGEELHVIEYRLNDKLELDSSIFYIDIYEEVFILENLIKIYNSIFEDRIDYRFDDLILYLDNEVINLESIDRCLITNFNSLDVYN